MARQTPVEVVFSPGERTLHVGDSGPDVQALQVALGIEPADAVYGAETEAAVKRLQRVRGLPQQGTVGPATWPYVLTPGVEHAEIGPVNE